MIITETRPMEFARKMDDESFCIPKLALDLGNFPDDQETELHIQKNVLILLKRDMTAAEMLCAIEGLSRTSTRLVVRLAKACGLCDGCDGVCPAGDGPGWAGVPEELADLFSACGLCLGELECLLSTDEVVK